MTEGEFVPSARDEDVVYCEQCGIDTFHLVKFISNDTLIERTLRCDNGHIRVDRAELPPAHAL